MSFLGIWDTPVEKLLNKYKGLEDDIKDVISYLQEEMDEAKSEVQHIHNKLLTYSSATGELAKVYYEKIEDSKTKLNSMCSECENTIDTLKAKKKVIANKIEKLEYYRKKEEEEDKEYTFSEISV
ncbi:hypothetical protein IA938_04545 [Listeria welshimeri]|uniref:hypothetical protein n=1 Tax=Listeria welshimeri TaxID=1643 RepID=UPI0016255E88|nr:hypothetical protein [Listeria welshimeri]MBC1445505.1 hypothetical protein [Listeria welshimeri]MBC2008869.1 hypothetical protein [Listeria welshimeri]MBF2508527.1 hypothetical protein [Listeria welshimeri]MBF2560195.1 hypothetical protein [Listeria welshimeri]MBF2565920.1 hypothetical protein [Listeria welshimeri]